MTVTKKFYDGLEDDPYMDMLWLWEHGVAAKLGIPSKINLKFTSGDALAQLRARLVMEEAEEVNEALTDKNLHEVAKELADVLYVAFGTAVAYGIPMMEVFKAVHENNMLKLANSSVDAGGKITKDRKHPKTDLTSILGPVS